MARVQDKVAIVTGGGTGIGEATAELLASEGATVIITDINADKGREVAERIGRGVTFVEADVTSESDWQGLIDKVLNDHGKLDVLVNNAGVGIPKNVEETTLEDWRFVMNANLDGVFLGTRYAIQAMKESGGGSIVNMSSIEGFVGDSRLTAYNASKAGVIGLSKSSALHCGQQGLNIRVNTVHPGFIWTKMVRGFCKSQDDPDQAKKDLESKHALGHLGEPSDIAYGILYLASDESKFVTGTELVIDGGYTAQ